VPQLQGVQGRSCSRLPQAVGNAEDGVASALPKGKKNGIKNGWLKLIMRKDTKLQFSLQIAR
jgi:CRISPR/Cas system CMR-associated protein Cmr5 small subunit